MQPYELKPEEICQPLTFTEGGRRYAVTHFLRVPTFKDWAEYDAALRITLADVAIPESREMGQAYRDNKTAALGLLWDRLALRAEGYISADSADDADWKKQIPYTHKVAAAAPRALVAAIPPPNPDSRMANDEPYTPGLTPVYLLAAGGDYPPLIHWFRQAEAAQVIEVNRLHAERFYVRATRREGAKAIIPSQLAGYVALYDQLIDHCEGYCCDGETLTDLEVCRHSMDAWHKKVALRALFIPPAPEPEAAEAEAA